MSSSSSESLPPAIQCFSDLPEPAKKKLKTMRAKVVHAMTQWRSFDQWPVKHQHNDKRAKLKKNSRAPSTAVHNNTV